MNIFRSKKQKKINKPKDEVRTRLVWVRIYTIFLILHFTVLGVLSYFFRELVREIDVPVEALPQTQLPTLNTLQSKVNSLETRMNSKTHSLLTEIKEEEKVEVVPEVPESMEPAR
jgi:hypothetical protein